MNIIPQTINPLDVSSSRAAEGIDEVGAAIGLSSSYITGFPPLVHDVYGRAGDPEATPPVAEIPGKQPLYLGAKVMHATARAVRREAISEGRKFVAQAVNTLKDELGTQWNTNWQALGFTNGSLRLPSNPQPVLTLLAAFYRSHAELEVAALNLTSARAEQVKAAIVSTQTAVDAALEAEKAAKAARDAAVNKLRLRLGGLREELKTLLSDDDTRWYRFGFRRPVDGETPDLVQRLTLRLGAPGEVVAEWGKARLAENYRVRWKVTGSMDEPTQVGIFADQNANVTGLPAATSITVIVTARNGAGESAPVEAAVVVP